MLCQDKAVKLGIRTARLPIGTYLAEMPTRKVLTVNQVSDGSLLRVNTGSQPQRLIQSGCRDPAAVCQSARLGASFPRGHPEAEIRRGG